jgi:hypothetical protein
MTRRHLARELSLNSKHHLPSLGEPTHSHWSRESQPPSEIEMPNRLRLPGQAFALLIPPQHHNGVIFYTVLLRIPAESPYGIFS